MTEQQEHLTTALNQQKTLASEIQELNNTLTLKREQFLKLQGVVLPNHYAAPGQEQDSGSRIEAR